MAPRLREGLGLVAGVGRTTFAMAREGDLPRPLAAVHARSRVPYAAERAVGSAVVVLVLVADLRTLIGFSSFGVLAVPLHACAAAGFHAGVIHPGCHRGRDLRHRPRHDYDDTRLIEAALAGDADAGFVERTLWHPLRTLAALKELAASIERR